MNIKFMRHGDGDPRRAVRYLLGDRDHKGVRRPNIAVLRGSPELWVKVTEQLDFKWRYVSAVIAWAPTDQPSFSEMQVVLDDFEALAYSGLPVESRSMLAVRHSDHIHILISRVDLQTGLSFNPLPPGSLKAYGVLGDYWNAKKGWANPAVNHLFVTPYNEAADRAAIREELHGMIQQGIENRSIRSQEDIQAALKKRGFRIVRASPPDHPKPYLSIKHPKLKRAMSLRGRVFSDINANERPKVQGIDIDRSNAALLRFMRHLFQRKKYNTKRYLNKKKQSKKPIISPDLFTKEPAKDDIALLYKDFPEWSEWINTARNLKAAAEIAASKSVKNKARDPAPSINPISIDRRMSKTERSMNTIATQALYFDARARASDLDLSLMKS